MIDPAMLALLLVQDKGAWEAYAAQSRTRRSPPPDESQSARSKIWHLNKGGYCNGKSSSLRTDWKGLGQDHQEHVRWDFAGGQAAGQGLHVGAQKQRPTEGRALIDGLTYVRMPRSMTLSPTVARFDDILAQGCHRLGRTPSPRSWGGERERPNLRHRCASISPERAVVPADSVSAQGRSARGAGPGPGGIRIGHCFESNSTAGGRNCLIPSLALSAAIATRASPPISS